PLSYGPRTPRPSTHREPVKAWGARNISPPAGLGRRELFGDESRPGALERRVEPRGGGGIVERLRAARRKPPPELQADGAAVAEGLAVVAHDRDQRALEVPALGERVEQLAELRVSLGDAAAIERPGGRALGGRRGCARVRPALDLGPRHLLGQGLGRRRR